MGVIGLDLSGQFIGGMPGKLGWPRQQSKHTLNANNNDALIAEAEAIANGAATPALV